MTERARRRDIVLVVDDAPDTLRFLTDTLEGAGVTVLIATDGESCLALVDEVTPHLILMDAMMPGLDGFQTCRRLKQEKGLQHVPVIFMTGLSDTEHVLEGLQAGGVDYVAKPIVVEELLARIRVHLANARVTIFGDVHRLPDEYQGAANEVFKAKYEARKEEVDLEDRWGDYTFYRMNNIIDVYFVGGFGTLNWVNLDEYKNAKPDNIVTPSEGSSVLDTLAELNTRYGVKLATSGAVDDSIGPNESVLSEKAKVDDVWIISIDKRGVDVRVRVDGLSQVRRLQFQGCVDTFNDACDAVEALIAGTVWGGGPCEDDEP